MCHFSGTPSGVSMRYFSRQKGRYAKPDPPGLALSRSLPSLGIGSRAAGRPSSSSSLCRCVALSLLSALLAAFLLSPRSFPGPPGRDRGGITGRDDSVSITFRLLESQRSPTPPIPTDIVPEHRARPRRTNKKGTRARSGAATRRTIVNNRVDYFARYSLHYYSTLVKRRYAHVRSRDVVRRIVSFVCREFARFSDR